MNIALIGATGFVGTAVLNELLQRGHRVSALARNPAKLAARHGLTVVAADAQDATQFADVARQWSNCPSSKEGGELGWLTRADCAPEFAAEVFSSAEVGVVSRLVHSRFGLHLVEVQERKHGQPIAFEDACAGVRQTLHHHAWTNAVRQY